MHKSEAEIQEEILDYLEDEKICHWRMETTGIPIVNKAGKLILTKNLQRRGMADILAIYRGVYTWIEVKSMTGYQSTNQIIFEKKVREAGSPYIVVRSVEELVKGFEVIGMEYCF